MICKMKPEMKVFLWDGCLMKNVIYKSQQFVCECSLVFVQVG